MIDYRIKQEESIKSLQDKRLREMSKLKSLVQEIRRNEQSVREKVQESLKRKREQANLVKQERVLIKREINKFDQIYLHKAMEKRIEVQVL